ncbi:lytic transglycosylase domain-containing protein [Actinokineospora inagensis]|uniref:lytic transglycosylase domain-containing protein n=1 Tax=Actinokineospora inagensis TaxID=103730 RepID=UPI0003FA696B|nr:lytic murein transglycosylase [Actinokineospora inagensis]
MADPKPRGRTDLWFRVALVVVLLAVVGAIVWIVRIASVTPQVESPAAEVAPAQVEPDVAAPVEVAEVPRPGRPDLRGWANRLARPTGIPARALLAYGNAELVVRASTPRCGVSWATLAGIGRIESNHGQYGGATLGDDGRPSKPIVGVPLDGSTGVRDIPDTDHGEYDGDTAVDRAVGPLQFIPSTWRKWTSDGNGDGIGDPQQIDDAALAAARYLCADGRDMTSPKGWWQGVFSYNNSVTYGQKVFGLADGYARAALG